MVLLFIKHSWICITYVGLAIHFAFIQNGSVYLLGVQAAMTLDFFQLIVLWKKTSVTMIVGHMWISQLEGCNFQFPPIHIQNIYSIFVLQYILISCTVILNHQSNTYRKIDCNFSEEKGFSHLLIRDRLSKAFAYVSATASCNDCTLCQSAQSV